MIKNVNILGKQYDVVVYNKEFSKFKIVLSNNEIFILPSKNNFNIEEELGIFLRNYSKKYIFKRVELLANTYGFKYKRISIRDQRTRWGSCSSVGNLNFNWRLILANERVLDYVIVHELVHTVHMNHSKDFWNTVESIMPDYIDLKKWLKFNGRRLFLSF